MVEFQPPRGTRDFGPEEMARRRQAERDIRKAMESFGYREVATPTFEHADLFISRSGPQVVEQMYLFKDKGGRDMVLRPELTAAVMRFYSSELKNRPKPLRIYYFGNCFRYERPQKGRYREFWQIGLEYIGKRTPQANAEVISAAVTAVQGLGLDDFQVRIGHVSILRSLLSRWGLDVTRDKELMISIDKKDVEGIRKYLEEHGATDTGILTGLVSRTLSGSEAKDELDRLSSEASGDLKGPSEELAQVLSLLSTTGATILFDPSISRGLDYYDGVVFEIDVPSLGAEKQVCGGGAYSLSSLFSMEVEGIGFALGFDRLLMAKGDAGADVRKGGFFMLPLGKPALQKAFEVASLVRRKGAECILETSERPMKKAIANAVESGCRYLMIIGDDEVRSGRITLKDLSLQEQRSVTMEELGTFIERLSSSRDGR